MSWRTVRIIKWLVLAEPYQQSLRKSYLMGPGVVCYRSEECHQKYAVYKVLLTMWHGPKDESEADWVSLDEHKRRAVGLIMRLRHEDHMYWFEQGR